MYGVFWVIFLVMPLPENLKQLQAACSIPKKATRSRYEKKVKRQNGGYYSVYLSDYKVKAEMTAAPHSGILRFTFDR